MIGCFLRYIVCGLVLAIVWAVPVQAVEIEALDATLHGFLDARYGQRLQEDPFQRDESLAETRLQLGLNRMGAPCSCGPTSTTMTWLTRTR